MKVVLLYCRKNRTSPKTMQRMGIVKRKPWANVGLYHVPSHLEDLFIGSKPPLSSNCRLIYHTCTYIARMPSRTAGGSDGGSQTSPGEDPLEAGRAGLGGTPMKRVSSGDRNTLPVRYRSRRWLKSWSRGNSSEAETSPRPHHFWSTIGIIHQFP